MYDYDNDNEHGPAVCQDSIAATELWRSWLFAAPQNGRAPPAPVRHALHVLPLSLSVKR